MANIKINNLNKNGSALFNDTESYLTELTEQEMKVTGGIYTTYFLPKIPRYIPKIWV